MTLETKTPLVEMDFVGFTLQYEMSFTTILNMLELAGMPVYAKAARETNSHWSSRAVLAHSIRSHSRILSICF